MITIKDSKQNKTTTSQCCAYVAQLHDGFTATAAHINEARLDEVLALLKGLDELKERILNSNTLIKEFYNLLKKANEEKERTESFSSLLKDFGVIVNDNNE